MDEPDYNSYTLEELKDVEAHIDKDAYPERYAKILSILNDPQKLEELEREHKILEGKRAEESESNQAMFGAMMIWVYGGLVAMTGIAYQKFGRKLEIESGFIRVVVLAACLVYGYRFLVKRIGK